MPRVRRVAYAFVEVPATTECHSILRLGVPHGQRLDAIGLTEETKSSSVCELSLVSDLTGIVPIGGMGMGDQTFPMPNPVAVTTGGFVGD